MNSVHAQCLCFYAACGTSFDFHRQIDYLFLVGTEDGKIHKVRFRRMGLLYCSSPWRGQKKSFHGAAGRQSNCWCLSVLRWFCFPRNCPCGGNTFTNPLQLKFIVQFKQLTFLFPLICLTVLPTIKVPEFKLVSKDKFHYYTLFAYNRKMFVDVRVVLLFKSLNSYIKTFK